MSVLFRPVAAIVLLTGLAGCVVPPQPAYPPPAAGTAYYLGSQCAAGAYQCPVSGPVGAPCSCPGLGAPSYGVIR